AVETALLTEVNLPWYTAGLAHGLASCPDPIQQFVRVWTSEEDQHATLLESYLLLTRSGDPGARARSRKAMIAGGGEARAGRTGPGDGLHGDARGGDPHVLPVRGSRLWRRGSAAVRGAAADPKDETLHMAFYRDVVKAHLDKDPDYLRPLAAVM